MYTTKDFYDTLIENLDNFDDDYASFIDSGPNLYKLLTDVLHQEILSPELRLRVSGAIAYYVVPNDVIPEDEYGPYGYIDDIFISVYVLREVADEFGYQILQDLWELDTDVKDVMDNCYTKSVEILEDQIDLILAYVGLKCDG